MVDTPALLVYPPLIKSNIERALQIAGGPGLLRPHVKTHKMVEVTRMLLSAGITKFKCATIAELEMLVIAGARDILLAYQPTVVKAQRLANIAAANPGSRFGYLVDNKSSAQLLDNILKGKNLLPWIDINVGMNRTGIAPENVTALFADFKSLAKLPVGLHAYDGHIHDTDISLRYEQAHKIFEKILAIHRSIQKSNGVALNTVIGGTPCFPYYAQKHNVETSPGTFVLWDYGYSEMLPDMKFDIAAVLLTRVISIIDKTRLCLDLGHKSIAAENPLPRVYFPNYSNAKVISQSEEHLVVEVEDTAAHNIGDEWYGIPAHICPTVALYESVHVVENNQTDSTWQVIARNRKITF